MKTNLNPNHHIWNNNGTYWCHYTVHHDDYTKQRVRVSLGTNDVAIARALRDFVMEATPKIASDIPGLAVRQCSISSRRLGEAWSLQGNAREEKLSTHTLPSRAKPHRPTSSYRPTNSNHLES